MQDAKRAIDEYIETFDSCDNDVVIINVYGGQTKQTLEDRFKSHKDENKKITNKWRICPVHQITVNSNKQEMYYNRICKVEQYLINKLHEKYGDKCINDMNNDNTVAQRGGAGLRKDEIKKGDVFTFYNCFLKRHV